VAQDAIALSMAMPYDESSHEEEQMTRDQDPPTRCEACQLAGGVVEVPASASDGRPFQVCAACAERLRSHALRPVEWFNLAVLHGPLEAELHDDFYDDDGTALAPHWPVDDADRWPAPTLDEAASAGLEPLLDFALSRFTLREPELEALRRHSTEALLEAMRRRASAGPDWVEWVMYKLCGMVVGPPAASWLRQAWPTRHDVFWSVLVPALAACLPRDEGIALVLAAMDAEYGDDLKRASWMSSFGDARVLDWMERRVRAPGTGGWGSLAAYSGLTWARAESWLERGRPLSMVALDALLDSTHHDDQQRQRRPKPLQAPGPRDQMIGALRRYSERDPVPRVRAAVDAIIRAWLAEWSKNL